MNDPNTFWKRSCPLSIQSNTEFKSKVKLI